MISVRPPAVAGSFYPAPAAELSALLDHCFNTSPLGPQAAREPDPAILAAMVPHAGPIYSGPCAAHLYARLDPAIRRVVILGIDHRNRGHKASLGPWQRWRTPLGEIAVDDAVGEFLQTRVGFLNREPRAHGGEHSIEIQLPFLQRTLGDFYMAPISVSQLTLDECAALGAAIAAACQAHENMLILASSDLSHYLSPEQTERLDRLALDKITAIEPAALLRVVEENHISMCGALPTAVMLFAAQARGAKDGALLKHCHSGDVAPMRQVVGYASVAIRL